ncbi:MAG: hypothetical protein AAFU64_18575 [Bacteroidota bacterium]
MKQLFSLCIVFLSISLFAFGQNKTPQDFGFRHLSLSYQEDPVEILIKSKKGEENLAKPLFLFCEGSLPQPLLKTDGEQAFGVYPFQIPEGLLSRFHLIIISKPYLPLVADKKDLGPNFMVLDAEGMAPPKYRQRSHLDYYVQRNIAVLQQLATLDWVKPQPLVIAGHSQGSTVAAHLAARYDKVSHLIYSGGNPAGRIMSILAQSRARETDSLPQANQTINYWKEVIDNANSLDQPERGDTYKATFDFSKNLFPKLLNLEIPTLISYGTKDNGAPFNDYLQVESIRQGKKYLSFKAYIGTEHNYFPVRADGTPN